MRKKDDAFGIRGPSDDQATIGEATRFVSEPEGFTAYGWNDEDVSQPIQPAGVGEPMSVR